MLPRQIRLNESFTQLTIYASYLWENKTYPVSGIVGILEWAIAKISW